MQEVWQPKSRLPIPDTLPEFEFHAAVGEPVLLEPDPAEAPLVEVEVEDVRAELGRFEDAMYRFQDNYPILGKADTPDIRLMGPYLEQARRRATDGVTDLLLQREHERAAEQKVETSHQNDLSDMGLRAQWQADQAHNFTWLMNDRLQAGVSEAAYTAEELIGIEMIQIMLLDLRQSIGRTNHVAKAVDLSVLEQGLKQAIYAGDAETLIFFGSTAADHFKHKARHFYRTLDRRISSRHGGKDRRSEHAKLNAWFYQEERRGLRRS